MAHAAALTDDRLGALCLGRGECCAGGGRGEAHRRYTRRINFREGWRGYLFQGRFASYPMDDAHLMAAVRYVENNPVAARMVADAGDYRWSSARSHLAGKRVAGDPLSDVGHLGRHVRNWRAMLRIGLEAMDSPETVDAIEARLRTGRPLASPAWIAEMEARIARKLGRKKPGPKPKAA